MGSGMGRKGCLGVYGRVRVHNQNWSSSIGECPCIVSPSVFLPMCLCGCAWHMSIRMCDRGPWMYSPVHICARQRTWPADRGAFRLSLWPHDEAG